MIKNKLLLNERREYVGRFVREHGKTQEAVKILSKELYLCEQTIYNDLAKSKGLTI